MLQLLNLSLPVGVGNTAFMPEEAAEKEIDRESAAETEASPEANILQTSLRRNSVLRRGILV